MGKRRRPAFPDGTAIWVQTGARIRVYSTQMGSRTLREGMVATVHVCRDGKVLAWEDVGRDRKLWICQQRDCEAMTPLEMLALAAK